MKKIRKNRRRITSCAFVAGLTTGACLLPRIALAEDSTSSERSPIGEMSFQTLGIGTQSGCARAAKMLITDAKEWRRVWKVHTANLKPAPPLPNVDWSHQAVIALLGGQERDASIQINQIVRAPTAVVVFFDNHSADAGVADADNKKTGARSFHFALIEKPQTPLRFQDLSSPECATCVLKPGE